MVEDESNKPNFVRGLTKLDYLDQNEAPIHSILFNKKILIFLCWENKLSLELEQ